MTASADEMDILDTPVDSVELLWEWCRLGWKYRGFDELSADKRKEWGERVEYEMNLIVSKDFVDYFLVLSDVVRKAKDQGVAVGPARGSAAASLVCFLIRITEVNPMLFPLMLFERFIAPDRNDEPDIDLDFEDDRRDEVRQIMIAKYGEDRVGNIGTFTRYRGKNSIDDVARVYNLPRAEINAAKEFLVERSGGDSRFDASIQDTVDLFPQVKDVFDKYPELYKTLILEGNYKSFGVHAAGLVVGADHLWKYVATYGRDNVGKNKNSVQVLSVDKYDGEHLGLMKLDALGLQTMGMIRIALDSLGMSLDELYDIPMDDQETLDAFERADVAGIFQFEGRTMKLVCEELKPKSFMDLAAVNALARPGPLHSGSTGEYIAIRHKRKERVDIHPLVAKICEPTEGQIIYQEQILQICGDIGKLPWTHRSAIRKIISSKKGEGAFNALWQQFYEGAASQGIDEYTAKEIWKRMVTAGTYAFNVAHCVSYSMLGFWAMWLKVHHPLEFYAAQLHKTEDVEKRVVLMRDMGSVKFGRDFKVLPPKPGLSRATWVPTKGGVRAGFLQIPGVGEARAKQIEEFDNDVGIVKWSDLTSISGFGPKTVEKIAAFADDDDPFDIDKVHRDVASIKEFLKDNDHGMPFPRSSAEDVPYEAVRWKGIILGRLRNRNLMDLFENHRSRSGEELDPKSIKSPDLKDSMTLYLEDETALFTAKVNRFNYPRMKEALWDAKIGHDYILARTFSYPSLGKTVHIEEMWIIDPD